MLLFSKLWLSSLEDSLKLHCVLLQYPLLAVDKRDFVYESCALITSTNGSVEGSFTFVPGRYKLHLAVFAIFHFPFSIYYNFLLFHHM